MSERNPHISVVVPLLNEEESLPELHEWIARVMVENHFTYEVIYVNDGSTDGSWDVIRGLSEKDPEHVHGLRFRANQGKSAALNVGFKQTRGDVVITLDADLQDSPDEIPELRRMIVEENYDLISGWKKKRHDPVSKTVPTRLFNWATRKMSGIYLHDFNCGLKAYRGDVARTVDVHGEMHRYIPVLAKYAGFTRIGEKVVHHQARKYGTTKFGMDRFINGFLDLLTLFVVTRFSKRPMHFFGTLGTLMLFVGFVALAVLGVWKIWSLRAGGSPGLIADNPLFYIFLAAMILGTQLFTTGFLAEIVLRSSAKNTSYPVAERIEPKE